MSNGVGNPPFGATIDFGQPLGTLDGDPGFGLTDRKHNLVVAINPKSRKIANTASMLSGAPAPSADRFPVLPGSILIYWGKSSASAIVRGGQYLPYAPLDGVTIPSSVLPVNPWGYAPKWQDILSRFAHDVMTFNPESGHLRDAGTFATGHLATTDAAAALKNKVTYQLGRAVIGVAYQRLEHWKVLDAEAATLHPETVDPIDDWKVWLDGAIPAAESEIPIPNMGDMMAMICGDEVREVKGLCVGAWVYQLNTRIGESSYNTNMNFGGEIRLPDTTRNTWYPHRYLSPRYWHGLAALRPVGRDYGMVPGRARPLHHKRRSGYRTHMMDRKEIR